MIITLHGASVECLACLECYYTTEYKLDTIQHPCIIEDSNIYQYTYYQDGIILRESRRVLIFLEIRY